MNFKLRELDFLISKHIKEEAVSKDECLKLISELQFHGELLIDKKDKKFIIVCCILLYGTANCIFDIDQLTEKLCYPKKTVSRVVGNIMKNQMWKEPNEVNVDWLYEDCEYPDFDFLLCALCADGEIGRWSKPEKK